MITLYFSMSKLTPNTERGPYTGAMITGKSIFSGRHTSINDYNNKKNYNTNLKQPCTIINLHISQINHWISNIVGKTRNIWNSYNIWRYYQVKFTTKIVNFSRVPYCCTDQTLPLMVDQQIITSTLILEVQ